MHVLCTNIIGDYQFQLQKGHTCILPTKLSGPIFVPQPAKSPCCTDRIIRFQSNITPIGTKICCCVIIIVRF